MRRPSSSVVVRRRRRRPLNGLLLQNRLTDFVQILHGGVSGEYVSGLYKLGHCDLFSIFYYVFGVIFRENFKNLLLQNYKSDLTHIWFLDSLGGLDYSLYKLGQCDLL